MSVFDLASFVDVLAVKRTELIGAAKTVVSAIFEQPPADPSDPVDTANLDETEPAEWWQHYGFISRPPKGTQSLLIRAGATFAAIASRISAAATLFGKLAEGDIALYSVGGNVLRLNADGSISAIVPDGAKHIAISISPKSSKSKGGIKVVTANGIAIEASDENGITLNSGSKPLTLASGNSIQFVAPKCVIGTGVVMLGINAAKPLVLATGPVPNVFVP